MSSVQALALYVDSVTKTYPGVTALEDVTLEVRPGEVHGIVGENGAGKSTLMGVISGAVVPDAGTVRVGGTVLDPQTPQRARELGVAIVRQEPALLPDLSVAENMALAMGAARSPRPSEARAWAAGLLREWGEDITIDPASRVDELPPEHRFIVEIARSFAADPQVLILDEPTEHLAGEDVERLFERVRSHAARGRAVLYISHRIHEVKAIASRITVLRDGRGRGTHDAGELAESDIVNLIVGRSFAATFPDKPLPVADVEPRLSLRDFRAPGVAGIDLDVRPGEILGLAGIEGNGQRETLRALAGLARSSGTVQIAGRTVRTSSPQRAIRAGIAYLPGDRHREGVIPGLGVGENVSFRGLRSAAKCGVMTHARERAYVERSIDGLAVRTPSLDTPIESLSGGNQQKAVLAGVIATRPQVLLADEPTQGVDIGAKVEIYRILRDLAADSGTAIIVVSADALELAGLCDRVAVFSRGAIVRVLDGADVTEEAITRAALTSTTERRRVRRTAAAPIRWLATDSAPVAMVAVAVIALAIYTTAADSLYLTDRNIGPTLMLMAPLVAVALGQMTVLMAAGIDLSVGPLMGFLVVVGSFFLTASNSPGEQVLGWVLIALVAIACGVVNWALIDRIKLSPLVATLATFFALQALSLLLRPTPGGIIDGEIVDAITAQIGPIPIAFIVVVVLAIALQIVLVRTRWGLAVRAIGSDPEVARVVGLRPQRVRLTAYVACSLLAGVGAIALLAQLGSGDPSGGTNYTLISISAAVIGGASIFGGRGSYVGALAGAVLVQQVVAAIPFLDLSTQWEAYLVGLMTLFAVALYSKSRQLTQAAAA